MENPKNQTRSGGRGVGSMVDLFTIYTSSPYKQWTVDSREYYSSIEYSEWHGASTR